MKNKSKENEKKRKERKEKERKWKKTESNLRGVKEKRMQMRNNENIRKKNKKVSRIKPSYRRKFGNRASIHF